MKRKSYNELLSLDSFEERLEYLKLEGFVGEQTFGYDRIFNQQFYHSPEWRRLRNKIIVRDCGCDLAIPGYDIRGSIYVHHINPITKQEVESFSDSLLDEDNLICVSFDTHNTIHYGADISKNTPARRFAGDTCPWRTNG